MVAGDGEGGEDRWGKGSALELSCCAYVRVVWLCGRTGGVVVC